MASKFPMPIRVLVVGVATIATAGACGSSKAKSSDNGSKSVQAAGSGAADVALGACSNDSTLNLGEAQVTITNHTSKTSNYLVTIAADSADGKTQIGTGNASAENLQAGQSTTVKAQFTEAIPAGAVCKVAQVDRYAS